MRIRLDISYNGAAFHGWAIQPQLRTVQGELQRILSQILRCEIALTVAGRTDAGVHARAQVAHFDVAFENWAALPGRSQRSPEEALVSKVNSLSGGARGYADMVVRAATVVPDTFDARFSALWRRYCYRIGAGVPSWDPLRNDVLWLKESLDVAAMNAAAAPLVGEHDFISYCKPRPGASTVRTLLELGFTMEDDVICANIRADAFCHSQVRTLVGSLIEVGRKARPISWPLERLEAASRNGEVIVAPAHGLSLEEIGYPQADRYATQAEQTRRYRG